MPFRSITVSDLRAAIENREVVPYYEPIVELSSGKLWGFEVLAHWHHPDRGLIESSEFIPIADQSWLIVPLVESLSVQVLAVASEHPKHLMWSFNLSAKQMLDRGLPSWIQALLTRFNVSPSQIMLELVEEGLFENFDLACEIARELKDMGIRIALDRFGTGQSSLRSLNALPLDAIKVDPTFVQDITERAESRKITAAVVGLGFSLGLNVMAEGIENKKQSDMLFYMGTELGQGSYFGSEVPASDIQGIIDQERLSSPPMPSPVALDLLTNVKNSPALHNAQLQVLYDSLPIGLVFLDRDFRYISINKWWSEQIRNRKEIPQIGARLADVVPSVHLVLKPYLSRALKGEPTVNLYLESLNETLLPGRDLEVSVFPIRDQGGEMIGVSLCVIDITEKLKIERELKTNLDYYTSSLEQNAITVFTADPQGKILWTGSTALGLSTDQVAGDDWIQWVHPDDRELAVTTWQDCMKSGRHCINEFRMQSHDGSWHRIRCTSTPRRNKEGEITGWYGFYRNLALAPDSKEKPELPSQ